MEFKKVERKDKVSDEDLWTDKLTTIYTTSSIYSEDVSTTNYTRLTLSIAFMSSLSLAHCY